MALFDLPLESIHEDHLLSLKVNEVRENRVIEYKSNIGSSSDEKKKFLAAISSFANTSGGDLLVGVRAEDGIPVELCGVVGNADAEKLRLENLIRDGLQPRLPSLHVREVPLSNGNTVLLLRMRRSGTPYHRVVLEGHDKFYGRGNAGKFPLDVPQLRDAFTGPSLFAERTRNYRTERVAAIATGETPVLLKDGAKTVIHVVPHTAFGEGIGADIHSAAAISAIGDGPGAFLPRPWRGQLHYNFDGFVLSGRAIHETGEYPTNCYIQVYADGRIEAVENYTLKRDRYIPVVFWESVVHEATKSFVRLLGTMGLLPPVTVMISLLGVRDFMLATGNQVPEFDREFAIDRTELLIPDVSINVETTDYWMALRPVFDTVWRAANRPVCPHYLSDGGRNPEVVNAACW